jgi:HD-like signal output (HDOD) protein/CheY-like chemotaxis protein
MATILVVDDMPIVRDPLAAMLKLAGHSALIAANGQEALGILESKPVDLVLLDLAMPVMDGITFLERLRAHPQTARTPVILLTAITDKGRIVEAARRGVQDCLLKSQFSNKELLARVQRQLATAPAPTSDTSATKPTSAKETSNTSAAGSATASSAHTSAVDADAPIPRLLTREQSLARAQKAMEVTTLSGVVAQVINLAASPRSDLTSLAQMISCDAVLAAKVLQAANSAAYSSNGGAVLDINDAVKRIGCATIRNIAATLGIYDSMPSSPADSEFDFIRCWQHSLAVANLCERLVAQSQSADDASVAYLIGLCHDLGQILFYSHFQREYEQVLDHERRTGKRRDLLERQMLGITHHDLISLILGRIGLPDNIRDPIQTFHDPSGGGRSSNLRMTKVLKLADAYANGLMLGPQRNCELTAFTRAECKSAIGIENPTTPSADQFRGDILAQTMMLARLPRSAERELTTPAFERASTRVVLTRDPSLSEFDPVATFLQAIANVHVQDRLPSMSEAAEFDRVVLLSRSASSAKFSIDDVKKLSASKPCLWVVSKNNGAVPADLPVQLRESPVHATDLAAFVFDELGTERKAAA